MLIGGWLHGRLAVTANHASRARAAGQQPDRVRPGGHGPGLRHALDAGPRHHELRDRRVVGRQPPGAEARLRRGMKILHVVASYLPARPLRRHDRVGARAVPGAGGARPRRARVHDQRRRRADSDVPHGQPVDDRRRQGLVLPVAASCVASIARRRSARRCAATRSASLTSSIPTPSFCGRCGPPPEPRDAPACRTWCRRAACSRRS